jgi:hypothetical protein
MEPMDRTHGDPLDVPEQWTLPFPEKGNRWVERYLSLRQTCRLPSRNLFPPPVDALDAHFAGHNPNLAWISHG